MFIAFTKSIIQECKWIVSAASVMAVFSLNAQADSLDNDIKLWLDESTPETSVRHDGFYYMNDEHYEDSTTSTADLSFKQTYKKVARADEKKVLRQLKDKFKVRLFQADSFQRKHDVYVNTLKREVVAKSHLGKARYELRLSEEQTRLRIRYKF